MHAVNPCSAHLLERMAQMHPQSSAFVSALVWCVRAVVPDKWCVVCVGVQKQPLLHWQSKGKGKADAPPTNGDSKPAADGSEAEGSEDQDESSKDRGEHWPAVQAAEANEPVGIITIEDVLEELIGQVWMLYCSCCALYVLASLSGCCHHSWYKLGLRALITEDEVDIIAPGTTGQIEPMYGLSC